MSEYILIGGSNYNDGDYYNIGDKEEILKTYKEQLSYGQSNLRIFKTTEVEITIQEKDDEIYRLV